MQLSRLDTQRTVKTKDNALPPKDSFVASTELELEWEEERAVVFIRLKKEGVSPITGAKLRPKKVLAAIVPLDCVAFMWPVDGED